jgi:hypothetical protein
MPDFCCAGAKVVVFLKKSAEVGWKLLDIRDLSGDSEARLERQLKLRLKQNAVGRHAAW